MTCMGTGSKRLRSEMHDLEIMLIAGFRYTRNPMGSKFASSEGDELYFKETSIRSSSFSSSQYVQRVM